MFYKMTEKTAHIVCPCKKELVIEIKKLKVEGSSILFGTCKYCNRNNGIILAGDVPSESNNFERHRFNQTLGNRLISMGQVIGSADTSVVSLGQEWKTNTQMEVAI